MAVHLPTFSLFPAKFHLFVGPRRSDPLAALVIVALCVKGCKFSAHGISHKSLGTRG